MSVKSKSIGERIKFDAYEGSEPYLFISYSHENADIVYRILNKMDEEKFRIWFDDTMEIGEDFREELRDRIEKCAAFVLFVSQASMASKYCGMEIITAFKNNKKIYPIYVEETVEIPAPLKIMLENLQHVNGMASEKDPKYINKMLNSLPMETMRTLVIRDDVLTKCKDGSTSVNVPEGVRVIGKAAFKECEKLEEIKISESVVDIKDEAFRGCKNIKEITLPAGTKKLGESVFRDCINLVKLEIKNDEIEIGERAFENCQRLKEITLPKGLAEIYGGVFNSCKAMTDIHLPENLTIIGESAFASCVRLKSIEIPPSVTKIDDMAFAGCSAITEISMNEGVCKIGKNAFKECLALKKVYLPSSVYNIGTSPFRGCVSLEEINVSPKNKHFKSVDNILFNKNRAILICCPAKKDKYEYEVPDSVVTISDWAFAECSRLNKILLPDSVNEIGEGAFYKCTGLKTLEIPDSVTKIDDVAFRGCSELEKIIIPSSVVEFGWGMFNGCEKVTVYCESGSAAAEYCEKKNIPYSIQDRG